MRAFLSLVLLLTLGAFAQGPYIPVWVDATGKLTEQQVADVVAQVKAADPDPQHIVVLIHGFATDQATSTEQYNTLGPRFTDAYTKGGRRVAVVGIQWDSAVDAGLLGMEGAYWDMIPRAHLVGRNGVRQVLIALQQAFPRAALDIDAHSMGCEVTAAALAPEIKFSEDDKGGEIYQPGTAIYLNTTTLAGSDLDYDIFVKSGVQARSVDRRVKLMWMTMSRVLGDDQDKVLKLRAMTRGEAAGATFPKMTEQQYDTFFQERALVFDNTGIPKDHSFLTYFDEERLARTVPAAIFVADPTAPEPEELQELDAIIAGPALEKYFVPLLDSHRLATQAYALWRLEGINCGGSQHFADGYLIGLAKKMRMQPRSVSIARKDSPCKTVREGIWPTRTEMKNAGAPEDAAP